MTPSRRSSRIGAIPDPDVREAFRETAAIGGGEVASDAPKACVSAIGGYPYMLQLVGLRCWQASNLSGIISAEAAKRGIARFALPEFKAFAQEELAD
ncbi:hypothetical protein [Parafannyhessea umbonata]|nr:hypothetical protein [Parafannyhessea umbonata]